MKNHLAWELVFVITLLCSDVTLSLAETAGLTSENQVFGIELPTKVSSIVQRFGKPYKIKVPPKAALEGNSEGQWFRWRLKHGAGIFSALGDQYSTTPNYDANVRFVQYMAVGKTETEAIYGFKLNKTLRGEVEQKFGGRASACTGNYKARHQDVLKLIESEQFTYFFFSPSGHLVGVAQSTFDMDIAG